MSEDDYKFGWAERCPRCETEVFIEVHETGDCPECDNHWQWDETIDPETYESFDHSHWDNWS